MARKALRIAGFLVIAAGFLLWAFIFWPGGAPARPPLPDDRAGRCKRLIDGLVLATQAYDDATGAYPPSGNASLVGALSRKREGAVNFAFPAGTLDAEGRVVDPWGRPLVYINNLDGTAPAGWPRFEPFGIYSLGPDGRDGQGSGDDVVSWK